MKTEAAKRVHAEIAIDNFQIFNQLSSDIRVDVTGEEPVNLAPQHGTKYYPVLEGVETGIVINSIPELKLLMTEDSITLLDPSSGWTAPALFLFDYQGKYQVCFTEKNSDGAIGIAMVGTVSTVRGL